MRSTTTNIGQTSRANIARCESVHQRRLTRKDFGDIDRSNQPVLRKLALIREVQNQACGRVGKGKPLLHLAWLDLARELWPQP